MFYFKFVFSDGSTQYLRSVSNFMYQINKYWDKEYTLFARQDYTPWQEVKTFNAELCPCGRSYFQNGKPFVGIIHIDIAYLNFKEFIDVIKHPWQCYICFWQKEILAGNWAPRDVYQRLGLPVPD